MCVRHDAAGVSERPLAAHQCTSLLYSSLLHSRESTVSVKLEITFTNDRKQVTRACTVQVHRGPLSSLEQHSLGMWELLAAPCWLLVEGNVRASVWSLANTLQAGYNYIQTDCLCGRVRMTSGSHNRHVGSPPGGVAFALLGRD